METKYLNIYENYDKSLKLAKYYGYKIGDRPTAVKNLGAYGIDEQNEEELKHYLRKKLNIFDGDGDQSLEYMLRKIGLIDFVDMAFDRKKTLLETLRHLYKNAPDYIRAYLRSLIEAIQDGMDEIRHHVPREDYKPEAHQSLTAPYYGEEVPPQILSLYRKRIFAFRKASDENYFPTERPTEYNASFEGYNRSQLIRFFEPENFYALSEDQVKSLLQTVSAEFLQSKGVQPCNVAFEKLTISDDSVQYGEYNPNRGAIIINQKILAMMNEAKKTKNKSFPCQLLSTLIHESEHRVQFSTFGQKTGDRRQDMINSFLSTSQTSLSTAQYLASYDELDARNEALDYIGEMAAENDSSVLAAFYNLKKEQEMNNGKANIPENDKRYFSDIYDGRMISTDLSLRNDMAKYMSIINSIPSEPNH